MERIRRDEEELLTPPARSRAFASAAHLKRNRDPSKASTALIITVNRQHDPAVKQAAPYAAEPRPEAVFGFVFAFCGMEVSHPFLPCVPIIEHFNGQSEPVERLAAASVLRRSPEWQV